MLKPNYIIPMTRYRGRKPVGPNYNTQHLTENQRSCRRRSKLTTSFYSHGSCTCINWMKPSNSTKLNRLKASPNRGYSRTSPWRSRKKKNILHVPLNHQRHKPSRQHTELQQISPCLPQCVYLCCYSKLLFPRQYHLPIHVSILFDATLTGHSGILPSECLPCD